jgi:tetratricopeptide (TPR) repeat protein
MLKIVFWCFIIVILSLNGCTALKFQEDLTDYTTDINQLEIQLSKDKNNARILRDLGIIYFKTAHYDTARHYLKSAYEIDQNDPKTIFYNGLSLEFDRRDDQALRLYEKYPEVSRLSPYRNLLESRYVFLSRQMLREEMRKLVQQEAEQTDIPLNENTLAVFPFIYSGQNLKYAPLGKGLTEMITIDLGKIAELQLVERVRLQALLDELTLAQTEYIDPTEAPRLGKLLGAGQMIGGSFNVFENEETRLDATYWDIYHQKTPVTTGSSDDLANFFQMEKNMVFQIVDGMGIELTQEQRDEINYLPTRNLEAFIQYSLGLEYEDRGNMEEAFNYFNNAGLLDDGFSQAKQKASQMSNLESASASKEQAAVAVQKMEKDLTSLPEKDTADLVNDRLSKLGNNINSNFVPGEDKTYPAEEADNSGVGAELPLPPPPPN